MYEVDPVIQCKPPPKSRRLALLEKRLAAFIGLSTTAYLVREILSYQDTAMNTYINNEYQKKMMDRTILIIVIAKKPSFVY